jgi:methyltransferase (TIGR00027 family)
MNPNQASVTAENNAALRTYESMRPEAERICNDPYAEYFIPERFFSAENRKDKIGEIISNWDARFPGVSNSIIARTRFIDDCLEEELKADIHQLVILGAGYDTRSLRFESLKDTAAVFELDHPATQKAKLDRIKHYLETDLSHVRYVPIDFSKEDITEKLYTCGYDDQLKTLFIWEGVTYYLPSQAVDRTLQSIRRHSAFQSSVVFDYFPPTVVDGTTHLAEALALREGLKSIGEEIMFGIDPVQIAVFMEDRGFSVVKNLSSAEYKQVYFKGANATRNVSAMFLFCQAMVS